MARPVAGPVGHRDGHGLVEGDDRGRVDPAQRLVQQGDLLPVGLGRGRRAVVQRGDGRLELVRAGPTHAQRPLDEGRALGDPLRVPARPILVLEQDEVAGGVDPRLATGVVQEHQGEQAQRLGLVGHQRRPPAGRGGSPRR